MLKPASKKVVSIRDLIFVLIGLAASSEALPDSVRAVLNSLLI